MRIRRTTTTRMRSVAQNFEGARSNAPSFHTFFFLSCYRCSASDSLENSAPRSLFSSLFCPRRTNTPRLSIWKVKPIRRGDRRTFTGALTILNSRAGQGKRRQPETTATTTTATGTIYRRVHFSPVVVSLAAARRGSGNIDDIDFSAQ